MAHNCLYVARPIHKPVDPAVGEYAFLCSRCRACYVCKHKAVYFVDADKWMWKCKDGKFREVILDGRLKAT